MGVNVQGDLHGGMPGQVLHRLDIRSGQDQLRDIGMTQHVRGRVEIERHGDVMLRDLLSDAQHPPDLLTVLPDGRLMFLSGRDRIPELPEGLLAADLPV